MQRNDNWNDTRGEFPDPDRGRFRGDGPEAIESHIRRTRSEMDETLDELARRLEPGRLLGDVWHAVRGRAGGAGDMAASAASTAARSAGSTIIHQAAKHPVPSALIGAGLVWMITEQARSGKSGHDRESYRGGYEPPYGPQYGPRDVGRQRDIYEERERASYEPRHRYPGDVPPSRYEGAREHDEGRGRGGIGRKVAQRASHAGEQISSRASHAGEQISSRGSHAAGQAAHMASESVHRVTSAARDAGDWAAEGVTGVSRRASRTANHAAQNIADTASHTYERYPLGVALAAMGAGLLAGMAAPNTRRENRWMGETSGRLRRQAYGSAREHASEAIEAGSERVAHAAESAAERAEKAVKGGGDKKSQSQSFDGHKEGQHDGQEHTESGEGGRMAGQSSYGSQIEPRH